MVSYSSFAIIALTVVLMFTLGRLYEQEKACRDLLEFVHQIKKEQCSKAPVKHPVMKEGRRAC